MSRVLKICVVGFHLLVDIQCVLSGLFQKHFVGDASYFREAVRILDAFVLLGENTLGNEIAAQLLGRGARDRTSRAICFESVGVGGGRMVQEQRVDSTRYPNSATQRR